MALKSDAQGFLVGELVDIREDLVTAQDATTRELKGVNAKLGLIARLLGHRRDAKPQEPSRARSIAAAAAAANRSRGADGRFVAEVSGAVARPVASPGKQQQTSLPTQQAPTVPRAPTQAPPVRVQSPAQAPTVPHAPTQAPTVRVQSPAPTVVVVDRPERKGDAERKRAREERRQKRDTSGRFVAGDRQAKARAPADDRGDESGLGGKIGELANAVKGLGDGADQMDPALAAASEVKQVMEPLGRGAMVLFGRNGDRLRERKRERWYQRILKAITGRKDQPQQPAGVAGDVQRGSFMGTLLGELGGKLTRFLPAILSGLGAAVAVGLGALVGTKLGSMIYEWLDKSGIATKVFDAFDSIGKWWKDKVADPIRNKAEEIKTDFAKGRDEALNEGVSASSGRLINDSRRLDAPSDGALPPSTSIAQSVGRVAGHTRRFMRDKLGYAPLDANNNPVLLGKVDRGARRRQDFTGIDGGADLAQFGTYTREEADRIKLLKSTGQNTAAFGRGGITPAMRQKIAQHATAAGLDPTLMEKIVAMESGGNAQAVSKTGAIGLMQLTGQTATGLGVRNRFDVDQNLAGGMRLAQQNIAALQKQGLPVTAENLYMMHQLGPKAAAEVIVGAERGLSKAQLSPETQKAMNLNYGAKSATAADYITTNKRALDARHATATASMPVQSAHARVPETTRVLPVTVATAGVIAQRSTPVPLAVPSKLPDMPKPPTAADVPALPEKDRPVTALVREPIGQDVGDRAIAHIVTGGLAQSA